jgi:hypothetical protein
VKPRTDYLPCRIQHCPRHCLGPSSVPKAAVAATRQHPHVSTAGPAVHGGCGFWLLPSHALPPALGAESIGGDGSLRTVPASTVASHSRRLAWPRGLSGTLRSWLTRPVTTTAFFAISWGVRHTGLAPVLAMPLVVALCACAGWPVRRVAATGEGLPTSTSWRWHPARLASQSCLPLFRNSAGQHYGDDSCRAGTPCVVALGLPAPQQEDGPMTDVTIRPYRPADLEACRALWAEPPQRHRDL